MAFLYSELIMMAIYIVLAGSFDLIIGRGGMFSIAHAAFFAIGAYSVGLLTTKLHIQVILAWVLGALICALLSMLLAALAVRVSSDYLIIASFGFLTIVLAVLSNSDGLTGGNVGVSNIPPPSAFGRTAFTDGQYVVVYCVLAVLAVAALLYLSHSPFGRSLKAIRDNPSGAQSLGKRPNTAKLWVFSIAGSFAGIAGAMYASYISFVSPDAFGNQVNVLIFAMVFVGGAGSVIGAVTGAIVLTWIPALISLASLPADILGEVEQAAYGLVLILMVTVLPGGFATAFSRLGALIRPGRPPSAALPAESSLVRPGGAR